MAIIKKGKKTHARVPMRIRNNGACVLRVRWSLISELHRNLSNLLKRVTVYDYM